MNRYTYNFIIPNIKYLNKLHSYIATIPTTNGISIPVTYFLSSDVDNISVNFNENLNTMQLNLLTSYLYSYSCPQSIINIETSKSFNIITNKINSVIYSIISVDIYTPPSDKNIQLGQLLIVGNISNINSNGTFQIRLYDSTNNKVLIESNKLNNTSTQLLTFNNLQNIPVANSVLEIHVKVSDISCICSIYSISLVNLKTIN